MRYRIQEIDLAAPPPRIALQRSEHGVAMILRRGGRPTGFLMQPMTAGSVLEPDQVAHLLKEAGHAHGPPPAQPACKIDRPISVTAVTCTRNGAERLQRCLRSVRALREVVAPGLTLEILVVDNAPSDDRTQEIAARTPGVRYVREPRRGLDFARNRALSEAISDFVAFFDDDVVVDRAWVDGFAEASCEHPDAAAITGPVLPYELETPAQIRFERRGGFGHRFTKTRFGKHRPGDDFYPCQPGLLGAGCNMALRRDVVLALGGFDEALDTGAPLPGGGDLDMLYRIIRGGYPIVTEPQCLVFHEHRRTHRDLRHQLWTWGLGYAAFLAKSYDSDPSNRVKLRRVARAWFATLAGRVVLSFLGRGDTPDIALAHFAGGVVGVLGEYRRSQKRVQRIREQVAVPVGDASA